MTTDWKYPNKDEWPEPRDIIIGVFVTQTPRWDIELQDTTLDYEHCWMQEVEVVPSNDYGEQIRFVFHPEGGYIDTNGEWELLAWIKKD